MSLSPTQISFLDWQKTARLAHFTDLVKYRDYDEGDQKARLNDDQKALFPDGKDPDHSINVCPTILNAKCDRLEVTGFELVLPEPAAKPIINAPANGAAEPDDAAAGNQQANNTRLSQIVQRWWEQSGMDSGQGDLHYAASRDSEAYLIGDFVDGRPRLTVCFTYDGESGVDIVYEDDDPRKPLYATKRWKVIQGTNDTIRRMNIYYPGRIEKYINRHGTGEYADANWLPYTGDGDEVVADLTDSAGNLYSAAVAWWTDTGQRPVYAEDGSLISGVPIGLSVIHFPNNARGNVYGTSDLRDVLPLQDQLNDASVDSRLASKFAGANVNVLIGYQGSSAALPFIPGGIVAIPDKEVTAQQFVASDLVQLITNKDSIYRDIATVSSTPLPMINPTAQVSAEGTLQQQEAPLLSRVAAAQKAWGQKYEDAIRLLLRLEFLFGSELKELVSDLETIAQMTIMVIWKSAQMRDDAQVQLKAQMWREAGMVEELIQQHVLQIPTAVIEENRRIKLAQQEQSQQATLAQALGQLAGAINGSGQEANSAGNLGTHEQQQPNGNGQGADSPIPLSAVSGQPANG